MDKRSLSERDICTKLVTPALRGAGWDEINQIREEVSFTKGRIIVRGKLVSRGRGKRADYILSVKPNIPIAIIEAKVNTQAIGAGLQQGLEYAETHLPLGWVWARLGDLSEFVTSGSRDWAKHYANEGAIFVRMGNLSKNHYQLRLDHIQRVNAPAGGEGSRTSLEGGDVLISITGDVGMLGLIPDDFGEAYINQHIAMVRPMSGMKGRYLPELFRSPFAQDQFNAPQRGIKNSFRLTDVTQFVVPLPPLAEQHRIVAKVDALMAVCDQLEASLTATATTRSKLLNALLGEALEPAKETSDA
ncbi:hypothetical protein C1J03_07270 [Sulfitobacter sp. SK012]|uniref:restriction endonuclease subunit S n=1 Tax=Sulfitobacter sp. SK012 TaxID=1389005 RepID=UPI000E0C0916|nr:restriction endonuclease subunit S [Sulfitobacter sp. SK012]AXI45850.1 hypothetical protein C1J03_07270 [Sulfitobacter sp. SK012]